MPYYEDQTDWGSDEYYALHRYLHRMLTYKRMDEIMSLDCDRISDVTKVLIYCIVIYYGMNDILELENMKWLYDVKPLEKPLILDKELSMSTGDDVYKKMNVIC